MIDQSYPYPTVGDPREKHGKKTLPACLPSVWSKEDKILYASNESPPSEGRAWEIEEEYQCPHHEKQNVITFVEV